MPVTAVDNTASNQQGTAGFNKALDRDAFLKLLVTELKYQDAMNPMQDREFIAQMAQFSSLEQMYALNKTMEDTQSILYLGLEGLLAYGQLEHGLSLLGREVSYEITVEADETDNTDETNEEKKVKTVTGIVTAIKQVDGQFVAVVDNRDVKLSEITLIR